MKRRISILLILALLFTGISSLLHQAYAITTYQKVTKYHLDMGVQHIWGTGPTVETATWQNGYAYGGEMSASATLTFGSEVSNVRAYALTSSNFKWGAANYDINETKYLKNEATYKQYYEDFVSKNIYNINCSSSGNKVYLSYSAKLDSETDFNLKEKLNLSGLTYILDLLGGQSKVQSLYPDTYNRLTEGAAHGIADNVYGYMYFTPIVIQYDVIEAVEVPIGDFIAGVDVPDSAKQGEAFPVKDVTAFDKPEEFALSELTYNIDGGTEVKVTDWKGTGLGETIQQSFDKVCTVYYTLKVWNIYGESKTAKDSIRITTKATVNATAILSLPTYTYEGHPALAVDKSVFTVNGTDYSARRAYEEGAATNDFEPTGGGTASKDTLTTANCVWPKRGNFEVKLNVNTIDGKYLSDIKPIEVRKTPYIIDNLGGFQKQNRKQLLNISVATYPGKPITDYYVELKDGKTGETILLTKARPQANNATIKTRAIKSSGNEYWTNFELQFLTKNTTSQDYRYTIYMKDSKGDTDTVQKTFKVAPDLPPNAQITILESFIRNKGTNIAEITAEDSSTTDGDQLLRTWTVDGANIKTLPGYNDLSFGSGQKVKHNKTGVGTEKITLAVKDVWIEPTLEEYITEADYLSSTTTASTNVINIAPTVRLEPINTEKANVVIITDKKNRPQIRASLNTLKALLIEKGFDPNISLSVAADADEGPYRQVAYWEWPSTVNCQMCRQNQPQLDSEYIYRVVTPGKTVIGTNFKQEVCNTAQPHVLQALSAGTTANSGYVAWSYPVNESRSFIVYQDNQEKYIYISCSDINKTTILNRDNGAYVTTLNMAIPSQPYVGNNSEDIYFVNSANIQKYEPSTGKFTVLKNNGGALAQMMGGKLVFVGKRETTDKINKNGTGWYVGKFDLDTEAISEIAIPDLQGCTGSVSPVDMDILNNVIFVQPPIKNPNGGGAPFNVFLANTTSNTMNFYANGDWNTQNVQVGFIKNEKGEAAYIYNAYVTDAPSPTRPYYKNISIYNLKFNSNAPIYLAGVSNQSASPYPSGVSYAKLHSKENKIYIMQGTDWEYLSGNPNNPCNCFTISIPSMAIDTNYSHWAWDFNVETAMYNGSLMTTGFQCEQWIGMFDGLRLFRNAISETDAKTYALKKNMEASGGIETYVVVAGENGTSQILNNEKFKNEIEGINAKSLFHDVSKPISELAGQIKTLSKNFAKSFLLLEGDRFGSIASMEHDMKLQPGTEYGYDYKIKVATGKAIDVFGVKNQTGQGEIGDGKFFEAVAGYTNYDTGVVDPFFNMSGGSMIGGYWRCPGGYGTTSESGNSAPYYVSFHMKKPGYVTFTSNVEMAFYRRGGGSYNAANYYINGVYAGADVAGTGATVSTSKKMFLSAGDFVLTINHIAGCNPEVRSTISNMKAVYFDDKIETLTPKVLTGAEGKEQTVSNTFRVSSGVETMEYKGFDSQYLTTKSKSEYDKYITSSSSNPRWGAGPAFSFDAATGSYSFWAGQDICYDTSFSITAPPDKLLLYSFNMSSYGTGSGTIRDTGSSSGEMLFAQHGIRVLRPGQTITINRSISTGTYSSGLTLQFSNIKIAEFDANKFGGAAALQSRVINAENLSIGPDVVGDQLIGSFNSATGKAELKNISVISNPQTEGNNGIKLSTSASSEKMSAFLSDFNFYKIIGGNKQIIFSQNFNSQNAVNSTGWKPTVIGNGKAQIVSIPKPEKEEDPPLVYKKGQLVAYNIFYDDYENDPSKKQYWRYTHTPMNDGAHPQAAFVLDEDGKVVSSTGTILSQSIPRFYIDGKYTVEHWQEDNTNRTNDASGAMDYTKYDKLSNVESITFYIEGGATAPWITSIKTIPATLKEGNQYQLQIGVDDAEKDTLRLTTEVYKDKKLIYTHKQTNIVADAKGVYPLIATGYPPPAQAGRYDVVCTVRDWSGAGIGSYKFTVISEGKITGAVGHTPRWDENRKKYNMKRFSDEINRTSSFDDYKVTSMPRQRGINVFWSGEKFMINAETEGNPSSVKVRIFSLEANGNRKSTGYSTELSKTGRKTASGAEHWEGSLWDNTMINRWGRKAPEQLIFSFNAYYSGGVTKNNEVAIIVDSDRDYWQLHRLW